MAYGAQSSAEISAVSERPMLSKLLAYIRKCGITFDVYLEQDGGFKFSSLVGADKKKLLNKLSNVFSDHHTTGL